MCALPIAGFSAQPADRPSFLGNRADGLKREGGFRAALSVRTDRLRQKLVVQAEAVGSIKNRPNR